MVLSPESVFVLLVLLVVVLLTLWHHARTQAGRLPERRPLPALEVLRAALGRGAETGRAIHISPGAGTIGSGVGNRATTAETIAGLLAAERVVGEAALNGASVLVSSGDAVTLLALRGTLRQAYQRAGQTQDYDPAQVQLLSHQNPLAYASGVSALYNRQPLEASQLVGAFGTEFLLLSEEGQERAIPQVAGTTSPAGLPLMILSTDSTLIGEEIFAAEAYLSSAAAPQARLMTQDALRTVILLLIIGGAVYSFVQPSLGLPPLPGL